ncbi:MAG: MBL fold metallo-hydrolase [Actinobacteria bacterium]|nr:MBL fold metallo-hydrolase [Actinomycetota bacterium]
MKFKKSRALVLIFAILLGSSLMSLRQYSLAGSELHQHFGETFTVLARVRTDPVATAPKVLGRNAAQRKYSFLANTSYGPVRVIASKSSVFGLLPGQKISITGTVIKTSEHRVAALIISTSRIHQLAPVSRWAKSLAAIRNGLRAASGAGDVGALIPGMVIGDTAKQSSDFKNDMRRAGLTHLVAVSGANFAIVSAFVLWCMQFVFRKIPTRLVATAIVLASFIALVRPTPSVLRAAAMAAVMLIAMRTRQRGDSLPALGFAIAVVVAIDPWQARDPGFALSVLATAGLLLLAPRITAYLTRWLPEKIAIVLAIPIAALALCLPIIVALSGYISPMSIVANIIAAPFVAPITIVGFIAALISPFSLTGAQFLIFFVKPFAAVITSIARWSAHFPVISLRTGLLGFTVALLFLLLLVVFRKKVLIPLTICALVLLWWGRFPAGDWDLFICDIGQGDAYVLNLQDHRAIVIDVGPDPVLIDKCLRKLHVTTISLLILTHPHADHIAGLSGALKGRKVEAEWFGNIAAGSRARVGQYSIEVLWPQQIGAVDENPNNVSIAAVIKSRDLTLFAAGDIEPPVQEQLRGLVGRVDIYKVAHHGSRFQDLTLMRELAPTLALISVGEGNSYGHPADSTISALTELHAKVLRTDRDGGIAIKVKNHAITFSTENSKPHFISLD